MSIFAHLSWFFIRPSIASYRAIRFRFFLFFFSPSSWRTTPCPFFPPWPATHCSSFNSMPLFPHIRRIMTWSWKKGEETTGPACVKIMQGVKKPRALTPPFIILSSRALSLSLYNNQRLRGVPLLAIDPSSSTSSSSLLSFLRSLCSCWFCSY